jgi:hypothetical protein
MKNLFYIFLTSLFVFSCAKEQIDTQTIINEKLELRSGINWCDGGETTPPAVLVFDSEMIDGECCVSFRFLTQYLGMKVHLSTTDWNFDLGTGNAGNNNTYIFTNVNGVVTYCFPQQGSHFLIQIYDGNGILVACNEFENQCD